MIGYQKSKPVKQETGGRNQNVQVNNGNGGMTPLYAEEELCPASRPEKLMAVEMILKATDSKSMTPDMVKNK